MADHCASHPCIGEGSTCIVKSDTYECKCPPGLKGEKEEDDDEEDDDEKDDDEEEDDDYSKVMTMTAR